MYSILQSLSVVIVVIFSIDVAVSESSIHDESNVDGNIKNNLRGGSRGGQRGLFTISDNMGFDVNTSQSDPCKQHNGDSDSCYNEMVHNCMWCPYKGANGKCLTYDSPAIANNQCTTTPDSNNGCSDDSDSSDCGDD